MVCVVLGGLQDLTTEESERSGLRHARMYGVDRNALRKQILSRGRNERGGGRGRWGGRVPCVLAVKQTNTTFFTFCETNSLTRKQQTNVPRLNLKQ